MQAWCPVPATLAILWLFIVCPRGEAAVWQWSVSVGTTVSQETQELPLAFLWIPPNCQRVRGVVVAQHNMEEEEILEHPEFRAALAQCGMAEVWISPPWDVYFRFDRKAAEEFQAMMDALAKESGYAELASAPIVTMGHSAAASFPWNFAAWNPQRTMAVLSISGQWPFWKNPEQPDWGSHTIDGVPGLVTMGEYEAAESRAKDGLQQRRQHPHLPLSMLAEPAGSHFNCSAEKLSFLAFYIRKVCQYRLPAPGPNDEPVEPKPIDPTRQGWLVDRWHRTGPPRWAAAPVGQYRGDAREAFWCFDEEMARRTEALGAMYRGKKVDLLGYLQDGRIVPQNKATHQQVTLSFLPIEDGLTFKLTGSFLDVVPAGGPEGWTGRKAGEAIGHAARGGPIAIDRICGPVEKAAADTFAIRFYRMGTNNQKRSGAIWLAATHPGDDQYRQAVQQAVLNIPLENREGPPQTIVFPEISDQPLDARSVKLQATADSGGKVRYYVLAGPAELDGDTLKIEAIPPRSRLPIKITIVAWQWGRSIAPKLQTAKPVERSFLISGFVHPGILHSAADLERMKHRVSQRAEPWYSGFEKLRRDSHSQADWRLRGPYSTVIRANGDSLHIAEMDADASAAYQNALMWCITGNEAHAKKACQILNAWSGRLLEVGGADRQLGASLGGFKFVNAAELMRSTYPAWSPDEVRACQAMLRRAIFPAIENFATFANGNWDAGCIKTQMAIGVFCDDRKIFDRAVEYFYRGEGNGRLTHYIVNPDGQCQESGRDQGHAQLGLGNLAEACEIGWHQQLDMYGAAENRLLKGFEYTARYNLGGDVPFAPHVDTTGKYHAKKVSVERRGTLLPIYEMVWNHYHHRRGLDASFTGQAVARIRPEGPAFEADHPGFGTLLFAEEPANRLETGEQ